VICTIASRGSQLRFCAEVLQLLFIGAHAAVASCPLLTRDVQRYRAYFPTVELIAP